MTKEEAPEFPKKQSSSSGTTPAYSVEARVNFREPKEVGGVIFHKEWKRVTFEEAKVGVPNQIFCNRAKELGLLSYSAAQALRWWFHASLVFDSVFFETRILKHVITYSQSEEVVGAFDLIGTEDRSSMMPDYDLGKK